MTAPDKIWAKPRIIDGWKDCIAGDTPSPGYVEYTRTASIPAPGADYVAGLDRIWCRDIDGTGSLHMCSKGDAGAIEFVPRAALSARPTTDTRVVTVAQLERWADRARPAISMAKDPIAEEIRAIIGGQANEQ